MHPSPLLIFDLDGTLVDSFPGIVLGLNVALADFAMRPIDLDWVHRHVGRGARRLVAAAAGDEVSVDVLLARFKLRYREVLLDNSPPLPGVDEALRQLALTQTLAVASNKPLAWVDDLVAHLGWAELMAVVVGPETVGAHKPDPKMLEHILRATGNGSADALFVGDMPIDAETGINAGIAVVGVTTGAASREDLLKAGCTAVLESVVDLVGWTGSGS